jgi:hypothetical protein
VANPDQQVGQSQGFVLAKGFRPVGDQVVLMGHDGSQRLFAELTADPDHLSVRPQEAYKALLASMQPGWKLRLLQISWPDPQPRQIFRGQVDEWKKPTEDGEGLKLLHEGLSLFLDEAPLPYMRRTILEFVALTDESFTWWEGLPGLLTPYGLQVGYLQQKEVETLAQLIFNPHLE